MNRLPELAAAQQQTLMTTTFLGYNHREIIQDGETYEEMNLTGDEYPVLGTRKARGIFNPYAESHPEFLFSGIAGRDNLIYIQAGQVYYNFVPVTGLTVSESSSMLPKKIVSFGAYVCIWPDKVYFNTVNLSDHGSMDRLWSAGGGSVSLSMCRGDGTDYDMTAISVGPTAPASPTNGQLWIDQSGDNDVLRQYATSTGEWVEVPSTYVKISGVGIGLGLNMYDCIDLSGLAAPDAETAKVKAQVQALNGSMIVYQAGEGYIVVAGLLSKTLSALKAQTVKADRTVPELDYVCESNNRLWGCRYGYVNGQVVNEIRASKLGDFRNWTCFMQLSTDSYAAGVGTDGPFTGCATQRGYPVFFKEEAIHRVSGGTPSTFSVTTTICRGVMDGCWRSVAVVNESIYYKSRDGVMMFDGSMPVSVGDALGSETYDNARAGAIGTKYYISMHRSGVGWQTFKLDTDKGIWHKEDGLQAGGFARVRDVLWAWDEENNRLLTMAGTLSDHCGSVEDIDSVQWAAVFGLFGTDYKGKKYLSRFDVRMYMPPESLCQVWIEYDSSGKKELAGTIKGRSLRSFVLPIIPRRCDHLRVTLTGKGEMKLYSISRILEVGSDA